MSNKADLKINAWHEKLASLTGIVEVVGGIWVDKSVILQTLDRTLGSLERDLKALDEQGRFIFKTGLDQDGITGQNAELIRRWQLIGDSPSLAALAIFAMQGFEISGNEVLERAVLLSGVLGEVENDLPYHNNMHYRKVLLQVIRLVAVHNDIFAGTGRALDKNAIAMLLIAASIHDLGHDGKGNTVKGVFEQGRLEKRSFDLAQTYLKAAGLNDGDMLDQLRVMLLCTEVTPLGDPANSMNQMKAAYRYHFLGQKTKTHTLNLDADLVRLQRDPKLTTMSLILHEGDVATSAGLNYQVTKYETTIYMREIKKEDACPQHVIDFLNQICQRQMLSDAAQRLYAANMARIYALAEEDIKNGDQSFPDPEHSDFLVAQGAAGVSRTLN